MNTHNHREADVERNVVIDAACQIRDLRQTFDVTLATARLTDDQLTMAANLMRLDGGHFAGAIGEAYVYADGTNRKLLLGQFGSMFLRYAAEAS